SALASAWRRPVIGFVLDVANDAKLRAQPAAGSLSACEQHIQLIHAQSLRSSSRRRAQVAGRGNVRLQHNYPRLIIAADTVELSNKVAFVDAFLIPPKVVGCANG